MRKAVEIELSEGEIQILEKLANAGSTPVRLAERSKIVLLASRGMTNQAIGWELDISQQKASRWRQRYAESGLAGIEKDAPPDDQTFTSGGTFVVNAIATSNLDVSVSSLSTDKCTVSNKTVTMVAAGDCELIAIQDGSDKFAAAEPTRQKVKLE